MFEQILSLTSAMYAAIGPGMFLIVALPVFGFVAFVLARDYLTRARSPK